MLYGIFFLWRARNTPAGSSYFKPKKASALEVSTRKDLFFYLLMSLPLYIALLVIVWRLGPTNLDLFGDTTQILLAALIISLAIVQLGQAWRVNRDHLKEGVAEHDRYSFKQVAILDLSYMVTFGSELAVVSMLPLFFSDTFSLSAVTAGLLASGYAFMNLVARPGGGWVSDKFGRKKSLAILLCGLMVGYGLMSQISGTWPIALAVIATMCCSFFVQAGRRRGLRHGAANQASPHRPNCRHGRRLWQCGCGDLSYRADLRGAFYFLPGHCRQRRRCVGCRTIPG